MGFLAAVVLSFVPALLYAVIVYELDPYEREPWVLVGGVFAWGATVAALAAIVQQVVLGGVFQALTGSADLADVTGTTVFAPLTEESLKGLAVLLVFAFVYRELDSVLDGVVYSAVAALGFAATENVLYLWQAFGESGAAGMLSLLLLRVVMGAWDHPFYTAFIGMGLVIARLDRRTAVRWLAPPAGWGLAVAAHSLHNSLATLAERVSGCFGLLMFAVDWSGWLFWLVVIAWALRAEGRLLAAQLAEEVGYGHLTPEQHRTASSVLARCSAVLRGIGSGRLFATRRFYQACAELAHKKHHFALHGDEGGNGALIAMLRHEVAALSRGVEA
jgi:RsiW-degrading membrane proteinase PrsW (M82 family)